jgi:flavorubredoxin
VLQVLFEELASIQSPWEAARALGEMAAEAKIQARLLGMLDTVPPEQQEQVVEAIGWMGAAGRPALERLRSIQDDVDAEPDLRQAAREAIQRIEAAPAAP